MAGVAALWRSAKMSYTIKIDGKQFGPATVEEIKQHLGYRRLSGSEPVRFRSNLGDSRGPASAYPGLESLIRTDKYPDDFIGPKPYVPNHIPLSNRLVSILACVVGTFVLYFYVTTGETTLSVSRHGPKLLVKGLWGLRIIAICGGSVSLALAIILDLLIGDQMRKPIESGSQYHSFPCSSGRSRHSPLFPIFNISHI